MGYKIKAQARPGTGSRAFGLARFLKKKTGLARKPESPYRAGPGSGLIFAVHFSIRVF
jgi:hypothetical protein